MSRFFMAEAGGSRDERRLGESLGPALIEQCGGRLRSLEWFRSTWQRGGAATGRAQWEEDDGRLVPAIVKLPVGPVEHRWATRLSAAGQTLAAPPTPRVYAAGTSLGGYDLGWLVMERVPGPTLAQQWSRQALEALVRAAVEMQALAAAVAPPDREPAGSQSGLNPGTTPDWDRFVSRARAMARAGGVPDAQRWNDVLRQVQRVLPRLVARWEARPVDTWCHGDLHGGNALWRDAPGTGATEGQEHGRGTCALIDLALVHAGHWLEDAVYLERRFWGREEQLFGMAVVPTMARLRRESGLTTAGDYGMLANVRRVLAGACALANLPHEADPRYLRAALATVERLLPQVGH